MLLLNGKPLLRQLSAGLVMDAVIHHGPISRAQIAKLTRISKQTASEVVRELEQGGWLRVHGQTRGNVGRTAVTYEIRPDAAFVAGIDLGGTQLRMAVANLTCAVVAEAAETTAPKGGKHVIKQIVALANRLVRQAGIDREQIRLVVVGTPGVVDTASGSLRLAPNIPYFDRIDVVGALREGFGCDIIVENDVNVGAIGEGWLGEAKGLDTFAYVALGTGLGMGFISNGAMLRGAQGGAGEIANLPIGGDPFDPANRLHGTLEAAVGSVGILRRYSERGGAALESVRDLFERCSGDPIAQQVIDETARFLALAVVAVAVTVDPEMVVFGGSIGSRPEIIRPVRDLLPSLMTNPPQIKASGLGNRAGIAGAIAIAITNIHNTLFAPSFAKRTLTLPAIDSLRDLGFAS